MPRCDDDWDRPEFGDDAVGNDVDDELDEAPSDDDIERFSGETAYCPHCGAEVWDATPQCPKCRTYLAGNLSHRPPVQNWFNRKMVVLIVILLLIGMFLWWAL